MVFMRCTTQANFGLTKSQYLIFRQTSTSLQKLAGFSSSLSVAQPIRHFPACSHCPYVHPRGLGRNGLMGHKTDKTQTAKSPSLTKVVQDSSSLINVISKTLLITNKSSPDLMHGCGVISFHSVLLKISQIPRSVWHYKKDIRKKLQ